MVDDKTQRVAYMKGFVAGHRKFEAEFETLLEVSEGRLREIDKLKTNLKDLIANDIVNLITERDELKTELGKNNGTK